MFVFENGCVVLWDVPQLAVDRLKDVVASVSEGAYADPLIMHEYEQMAFTFGAGNSRIHREHIVLDESQTALDLALDKFAFSDGIALSVKLGIHEVQLEQFAHSIDHIPEHLRLGKGIGINRNEILKRVGELLGLRHRSASCGFCRIMRIDIMLNFLQPSSTDITFVD